MKRAELEQKRIRELLQRGDPAGDDPGLDLEQVARMRRRVLLAAPSPRVRGLRPIPALALSALVVMLVAVGWNLTRPALPPAAADAQAVADRPGSSSEKRSRQVQFATPGGTRVIWILDSEFGV